MSDITSAIMVTGGSGFVGKRVVRMLAKKEKVVIVVYRRQIPETCDSVYGVCTDMTSFELLRSSLRNVATVVHLAWGGGIHGKSFLMNQNSPSNNLEITKNLIRAMEKAGSRRLVFVSAQGASPSAKTEFLREKYAAENLVINSKIPEKIILRASMVWDQDSLGERFIKSVKKMLKFPLYPVPLGEIKCRPIHVDDLAQAIATATSIKIKENIGIVEVLGSESYKIQELMTLVAQLLVKKFRIPLRGYLGQMLFSLMERRSVDDVSANLSEFLAMGSGEQQEDKSNALQHFMNGHRINFKERLTVG